MRGAIVLFAACAPKIDPGPVPAEKALAEVRLVALPEPSAPDVYFAAMVLAGSSSDPIGGEGTAELVARALTDGGAAARSSEEVREALFPTGNAFDVVVERDVASVRLRCHRDHAALCADLFADALVLPRFDDADVARLREDALRAVGEGLLADEEALGREVLDAVLYQGHPYGHPVSGRAGVLPLLDAAELRVFHRAHYVREAMVVGLAGGFDDATRAHLAERLLAVPPLRMPDRAMIRPPATEGRTLLAVDTGTPVTGFWLGHPIEVDRNHPDWAAMQVATTALGAHRQSFGRLFRALRSDRGLNYGDYAYVEPWLERGRSSAQEQGTLRRLNRFAVWVRPTGVENGPFALKLALDEVDRWVAAGLEAQEFEDVRSYLRASVPLMAPDPGRRMLYALEAALTGTPDAIELLPAALDALTHEQVNAAIARHVDLTDLRIVAVSGEAEALVAALTGAGPTPMTYADGAAPPAGSQAERDAAVAAKAVGIAPEDATVVEAEGIFR